MFRFRFGDGRDLSAADPVFGRSNQPYALRRIGSSMTTQVPPDGGHNHEEERLDESVPRMLAGLRLRFAIIALVAFLWLLALTIHSCHRADKSSSSATLPFAVSVQDAALDGDFLANRTFFVREPPAVTTSSQ